MSHLNINSHSDNNFCFNFEKSQLYFDLLQKYQNVVGEWGDFWVKWDTVPRELFQGQYNRISYISFYYLEYLQVNNPSKIADIGCGNNWFKNYIPNIIGYDNFHHKADYKESFDEQFISNHYEEFEAAFAINSLHFIPINQLKDLLIKFQSILKPGGRGYIALNTQRMLEATSLDLAFKTIGFFKNHREHYNLKKLQEYLYVQLKDIPFKIIVLEFVNIYDEWMDGNLRIVFEKQ